MAYDWMGNPVPEQPDPWASAPSVNFGSLSQIPNMNYYRK